MEKIMKKKKMLVLISGIISTTVAFAMVLNSNEFAFSVKGTGNNYGLSFDSTKNKFFSGTGSTDYSGQAAIKTNNNNDIEFEYYTVAGGSSSAWHLIKNGGYFYNTTPIHGLDSLTIMCTSTDKEFQVSWGRDLTFDLGSKKYLSSTDNVYCNFDGDTPTYFKFTNISGSNISIKEMSIALDCVNYYPVLSLDCNSVQGTVTGGGTKTAGESVTIAATPNTGYEFVGWFENDSLVSLNSSYTFTIGYSDLSYTARFKYSNYNLVVESESLTKGQVSNSSGAYAYLDEVTISATPNPGYSFSGWYNGDSLVSTNNPYTFTMPYNDIFYVAKFATNSYQLNLSSSDTNLGSITGGGTFLYESNVTISATPNTGVAFLGWFDSNDDLVSGQKSYSFTMPYNNLEYTAKFEWVPRSISLSVNDNSMGFVSGSGSYHYGQSVTLTATPTEHHSFFGWYDGDILLSQESSYTFDMPNNSLEYEARFVKNYYLNVYSDNEEMGAVTAPTEWGAGLEVTLVANPKEGYALDYWCNENYDELSYDIDYTFIMPSHNIEVLAVFSAGALLILDSNFGNEAISLEGEGYHIINRNVTIASSCTGDLVFDGWYDENYNLISSFNPYTFEFVQGITLIAYYHYSSFSFYYSSVDTSKKTCTLSSYNGTVVKNLYVPKLYIGLKVVTIYSGAFNGCDSVMSISIPNTIASIGQSAFSHCTSLTSIFIPSSVTSIGGGILSDCSSLTSVTLENGVNRISSGMFAGCISLASIVIPNTVSFIGEQAFYNCTSLTSINIPNGVKIIDDYVFYNCTSLVSVFIPNTVTSLENKAFYNCTSLASIVIPNSVISIKISVFAKCTSLTSIIIPNSVTFIGREAFYKCYSMTSIFIPSSVTSISSWAFGQCSQLYIYCEAKSKPIDWASDWNNTDRPVIWGWSNV